jgi:hypothetical protein
MDFIMALTQTSLLQKGLCGHVLETCAQLGQSRQRVHSQRQFPLTGAISMTCLQAKICQDLEHPRDSVEGHV